MVSLAVSRFFPVSWFFDSFSAFFSSPPLRRRAVSGPACGDTQQAAYEIEIRAQVLLRSAKQIYASMQVQQQRNEEEYDVLSMSRLTGNSL